MKTRKESFFGLHFDFHADPCNCPDPIGNTLKEEDIRLICRTLKPDFIQIDCKGHPGWTSYPSKIGNAMPKFKDDPLKLWRKVTKEEDVALYMHYSGTVDVKVCAEHPDWAVLNADGTRSGRSTRNNGPYTDEVIIPQFIELIENYGVNGVWVDGECWGSDIDYDPETVKQFEAETGIDLKGKPPVAREDKYYDEYRAFNRELFKRHLRKYVDALHAKYPDFQIASNWAFSDHMPERISADVDFISGDFNPQDSYVISRYAGRALARQDFCWDLMSWNFRLFESEPASQIPKNPIQIMQEAASVISLGGAYQDYITQHRDGSPKVNDALALEPLARFMRERQPFCHRGKPVQQVAVLLSTYDRLKESAGLYTREGFEKIYGLTSLLCDSSVVNSIVSEFNFENGTDGFPVIVVPETFAGLEDTTVKTLLSFAENGGSLLVTGVNSCNLFAKATGAFKCTGDAEKSAYFTVNGKEIGFIKNVCGIESDKGETAATLYKPENMQEKPFADTNLGSAFAKIIPYGKGKLAVVSGDLGITYINHGQYLLKNLITELLDRLYSPVVRVLSAVGTAEINILEKDGRRNIQIVNAGGDHHNLQCDTYDQIPPLLDVKLEIALDKKPQKLCLQPEGKTLDFTFDGKKATVTVERVDIHSIIEII